LHGVTVAEFLERARSLEIDLGWVHPDDRAAYRAAVEESRRLGKGFEIEYRLVPEDGGWIDVREVSEVVLDDSGRVVRTFGFVQDITERKTTEEALRQNEALLRQAMRTARMGAWVWDDSKDECLYCSEELALLFGQSVEEYLATRGGGSGVTAAIHPEDREHYRTSIEESLEAGKRYSLEFRERVADGTYRHFREVGEPLHDGRDGRARSTGMVQDITELRDIEQALRLSEAALNRAQRLAKIGHWRWDVPGNKLISSSEEYARIHGVSVEEVPALLDAQMERVIHPDDRDRVEAEFKRFDDEGIDFEIEYRIVQPDGEVRHVFQMGETLLGDDGRAVEQTGTLQDITDRKRIEEELRQSRDELEERVKARTAQLEKSERRYRTIFDTATIGIGRTRIEDGRIILANKTLAQMFGYDRVEDFVSDFVFSDHYVNLDDRARLMENYEKSRGTPVECTLTKRDGSLIDVRSHAIANYEEGILDFVTTDITSQNRAERALLESEERLRSLLDNSPNLICLKDLDGRYLLVNREFEEVLGLVRSEVLGKTAYDVFPEELARRFAAHDADVMECRDVVIREEFGVVGADGASHDYISCRFPLFGLDGSMTGIANIDTDISEHRAAEERLRQAQKMEAVGQLTGGVAHDFNNLLAVIMGNTELLSDRLGEEDPALKAIARAATRGAELTERLLAFSRRQPLRPQVFDPGALVSRMSEMLTRTLGETIEIKTSTSPSLASALADPGQLESALLNLALNARDAMPGGGKLIIGCSNIRLDEDDVVPYSEVRAGDYVLLTVSDTGTGMSSEVRDHAFEPFFTTKGVGQGSGLGLSMVYGFAKQSGGHVTIYSEEGHGTTVKLYLPRAGEATRSGSASREAGIPRGRGETILVIEDDPDVRGLAVQMLAGLNYHTIDVPDVSGARRVLSGGMPVDLVLSDVVLPGGTSGPEFAEEACAAYPGLKIIFMSGYPADAAKRDGFLGSDKVLLNKPFSRRQLAKALRDALD
jgi:PAS domain S-box-containing protein